MHNMNSLAFSQNNFTTHMTTDSEQYCYILILTTSGCTVTVSIN